MGFCYKCVGFGEPLALQLYFVIKCILISHCQRDEVRERENEKVREKTNEKMKKKHPLLLSMEQLLCVFVCTSNFNNNNNNSRTIQRKETKEK